MKEIDITVQKLGDGQISRLKSGKLIFKLSSYEGNPIVKPQDLGLTWRKDGKEELGAVFNPGASLYDGRVILTPRCHMNYEKVKIFDKKLGIERAAFENYISEIWILSSSNGVNFERLGAVIKGDGSQHKDFIYGIEDVRIVNYKDEYLLVGCGKIKPPFKGENADRVAIYTTRDFKEITYHGIISCFDSRNAVPLFQSENEVYMLLRFHPHIYIAPLEAGIEQILKPKEYENEWMEIYENKDRFLLLRAGELLHEREKIGPGPPPIRTSEGWLLIYHAVGTLNREICMEYGLNGEIGRGYSVCAALLDAEDPQKIICKTRIPLYIPSRPYELWGDGSYPVDVPAVVFPTGAILRGDKLLLYCGAGDKYVILLSCDVKLLLDYMFEQL
ncbi:hypothetical protein J7K27_10560 [Candidatus Bathyarchaeota archaeon]|nr:hypothetical protein [Candidatus Bathyarchaeota archaeon]